MLNKSIQESFHNQTSDPHNFLNTSWKSWFKVWCSNFSLLDLDLLAWIRKNHVRIVVVHDETNWMTYRLSNLVKKCSCWKFVDERDECDEERVPELFWSTFRVFCHAVDVCGTVTRYFFQIGTCFDPCLRQFHFGFCKLFSCASYDFTWFHSCFFFIFFHMKKSVTHKPLIQLRWDFFHDNPCHV